MKTADKVRLAEAFLRKKILTEEEAHKGGFPYLDESVVNDMIRVLSGEKIAASWMRIGGMIGEAVLSDDSSADIYLAAFYYKAREHACIGFLFEQEGIQGNDWAKDYAIPIKKDSFNLADMGSSRNLFWEQVANLYAQEVLDEKAAEMISS